MSTTLTPEALPLTSFQYTLAPGATADRVLDDAAMLLCAAIDVLECIEDRQCVPSLFSAICLLKQAQRLVRIVPVEGATS